MCFKTDDPWSTPSGNLPVEKKLQSYSVSGIRDSTFINTTISISSAVRYFGYSHWCQMRRKNARHISLSLQGPHLFGGLHLTQPPHIFTRVRGYYWSDTKQEEIKVVRRAMRATAYSLSLSTSWLPWQQGLHAASPPCRYKFSYSHTWTLTGLQYHLHMHAHAPIQTHSPHTLTHLRMHIDKT